MNIPPKYEDVVAERDALREEVNRLKAQSLQRLTGLTSCGVKREDLQQRLTVAEQRAGELESAVREMLRIAGIANQGSNAYNRAIINLNAALNPGEEGEGQ